MATAHQPGKPLVVDGDLVLGAALAAEPEQQAAVADELHVAVAQRRQAIAVVVARVLGVADAHARRVEQADDDREDLFPGQSGQREVAAQAPAQPRQSFAECRHALELGAVAEQPPLRMVAILLSAACVASGRLQVPVRLAADPDVFVSGRDRKARDALELGLVGQLLVAEHVDELVALANAPDARQLASDT